MWKRALVGIFASLVCFSFVVAEPPGGQGRRAEPPSGPNWLKIGFPPLAHDRMFGGSEVLSGLQALIYDHPARKEDGLLSVFDPKVLYRSREVWLNLDRLAPELADALRRQAAKTDPRDELSEAELDEYVNEVYYAWRSPYKNLDELLKAHPYRNNPDWMRIAVDSRVSRTIRVLYINKDRVADALASYFDNGDRVIYPPGTLIVAEQLAPDDSYHEAEVMFKRPDGHWTFLIYDHEGQLQKRTKFLNPKRAQFQAPKTCSGCHSLERISASDRFGLGRVTQFFDELPNRVPQIGDHTDNIYLTNKEAYMELTESVARAKDSVFGIYGTFLLSELAEKQKAGKLTPNDRKRYQRLQPLFPPSASGLTGVLPPLEK